MEEATLALGLEGWLASPQNGAGVVSSDAELFHTHRRFPTHIPPPRVYFPGHMGAELTYQLTQDGVVSSGRTKESSLPQISQSA